MKLISQIYILFIVIYIIFYKTFLINYNEIINYVINTLICIVFSITVFIFLYKNNKRYYKYEKDIIYIIIISSLLYVLLFYSIGFFVGFSKNPYSQEISMIINNLFSITLVIGLKEYVKAILINYFFNKEFIYKVMITLIFIVSDINLIMIINKKNE